MSQPDDKAASSGFHPLQSKWTMWYDQGCLKHQKWGDHLKEIYSFDTVENFWRLYNNLQSPGNLRPGCTYHLFKHGIRPEWEHDENRGGGKWVIVPANSQLDKMWEALLLSCIGETLSDSETDICGVVISIRKKQSKITIWTKNESSDGTEQLGRNLKEVLAFSQQIKYQLHSEAAQSGKPRALFTV